jgi:hypothetical protein
MEREENEKKIKKKFKKKKNGQVRFDQSLGGTAALGVAEEEEATREGGSIIVNLRGLR